MCAYAERQISGVEELQSEQKNDTLMAVLWPIQFTFVTLNILLGILFFVANRDFCGSVFETQSGMSNWSLFSYYSYG